MAKYGIFISPDELAIVAMKTTVGSPADGDWDSQDGGKRLLFGNSKIKSLSAYEDGSDIHVATQQENGRVAYHVFDPGTDAWVILDETVAIVGDHADFDLAPEHPGCSLALRSDGDVVLVFTGFDTGSSVNDVFVIVREGGSWGSITLFTNARHGPVLIGPDSSDRMTLCVGTSSFSATHTRSWSSLNALGVSQLIEGTIDDAIFINGPGVIDSSNVVYVPFIDSDDQISIGSWTSAFSPSPSTDNTVGDNTVLGNGNVIPPYVVACLAITGSDDVHLLYANAADSDIYHDNDVDGGGATDIEINDAVTCERISAKVNSDDSAIWYFYQNTGTANVVFDTIGLENFVPSLDSFRYYEDGTETGASAIDTQDTDISRNVDSDSDLQIRIRVQEQGAGSVGGASTDDWILQYDKNVSGFVNVTASSSNVKAFPSGDLVDAAVTTNRLGAGSGSFIAGEIDEANGEVTDHELTADNFTEYLWSVTLISADLANNDTLDFRVLLNGSAINSDIVPRITAVKSITTTPYYYQQLNRLQGIH